MIRVQSIKPYSLNQQPTLFTKPALENNVEPKTNFASFSPLNLMAYTIPFTSSYDITEKLVKQHDGKEYQGKGLYTKKPDGKPSGYIDWDKVGWEHLKNEPINWKTATNEDVQVFWHALALAETNDSNWPRRFNPKNVEQPLAVFRQVVSPKSQRGFTENLKELSEMQTTNPTIKELLDTKIVNSDNHLNFPFTVFDTETTGINVPTEPTEFDMIFKPLLAQQDSEDEQPSKIVQIGALKFDKTGQIIPESGLTQLINPEVPIPQGASNVHGITNKDVENKPTINALLENFEKNYMEKGMIVAYNSKFDIPLLNHSIKEFNANESKAKQLDERKNSLVLDPLTLLCRIHPYLGSRKKLSEQYKFIFGHNLDGAHDAFADVRGTADVLKYCLYYLDKKSKEKNKENTLTLRDILYFQNGHCTPGMNVKLDSKGLNADKKFDISYGKDAEIVGVDKFFDGYNLSEDTAIKLLLKIGQENFNILTTGDLIGKKVQDITDTDVKFSDEQINDLKKKSQKQMINHHYILKEHFKNVLLNMGIQGYGEESQESIIDFITENSKHYMDKEIIDIWMKNANPADISKGNDLPDIDIARKVMLERLEEDEKCKTIIPKALV